MVDSKQTGELRDIVGVLGEEIFPNDSVLSHLQTCSGCFTVRACVRVCMCVCVGADGNRQACLGLIPATFRSPDVCRISLLASPHDCFQGQSPGHQIMMSLSQIRAERQHFWTFALVKVSVVNVFSVLLAGH